MLNVSRSAYYAYQAGQSHTLTEGKEKLRLALIDSFAEHRRRYGSRRLLAELQEKGYQVGRHQLSAGSIIHSDRGGQYVGKAFRKTLREYRFEQSMSRPDDPCDNAFMASCWSRLKAELLAGGVFGSVEDACIELFDYIESYYNRKRRHSWLGNISPAQFDRTAEAAEVLPKFESKLAYLTVRLNRTTPINVSESPSFAGIRTRKSGTEMYNMRPLIGDFNICPTQSITYGKPDSNQ